MVKEAVLGMPGGKWAIFALMMFIVFALGMFIDWIGIVMIIVPLFTPIGKALGFDPIWFAMCIMVNLQMSFLTPPFAYSIFYLKGVSPPGVETMDIYRGVAPFVALQITGLILCILFPDLILWLPRMMIK